MMRRLIQIVSLCTVIFLSMASQAGIAIIVHPENYEVLSEVQLRNLYLGKSKSFPSGAEVQVLDLQRGNDARVQFLKKVLRRSEENLNAYWARMLFSSQGKPPKSFNKAQEVLDIVASDKNAIGYVSNKDVDSTRVRVLMRFE